MLKKSVVAMIAVLSLTACHHKKAPSTDPDGITGRNGNGVVNGVADADVKVPSAQDLENAANMLRQNFQRVHFEYDSSTLTASAKPLLTANAAILKKYPDLKIEIQGHCDERGTTDYNLALGQARARAVQRYLTDLGVSKGQLTATSFGEEQPLVRREDDAAFAANRRAEFRVTVGGDGLVESSMSQPANLDQM